MLEILKFYIFGFHELYRLCGIYISCSLCFT